MFNNNNDDDDDDDDDNNNDNDNNICNLAVFLSFINLFIILSVVYILPYNNINLNFNNYSKINLAFKVKHLY